MAKKFTYKWPINKNASDKATFGRSVIENFRDLLVFINSYVVTKEIDGSTVGVEDMIVAGTLSLANAPYAADGPEYIHLYRDATQAISGGSWETIAVNNVIGTAGPTFIADTPNNAISAQKTGIYLILGQVEFDANETGYVRITAAGSEVARASYNTATGQQVMALATIGGVSAFKMDVYNTTAANVNVGSNATFLRAVRLYSLV